MSQHYSDPSRENEPNALPNIEVFEMNYCDDDRHDEPCLWEIGDKCNACDKECGCNPSTGWFWQACFPGCLPDGDPIGPFSTKAEALADAQEGAE